MNKTPFLDDLQKIISAIDVTSLHKYTFDGITYCDISDDDFYLPLVDLIYLVFHCKSSLNQAQSELVDQDFIGKLSLANNGIGVWDPGWQVLEKIKDGYLVEKNGLKLCVPKDQFYCPEPAECDAVGFVILQKELRFMSPGFYTALGDEYFEDDPLNTVRMYWNVKDSAADYLTNLITTKINSNSIPFMFKVLNNPENYPRTDAAVLYVTTDDLDSLKPLLQQIFEKIKNHLHCETSIFTKRLAPGLGLSESIDGQSFGESRSSIVSSSLIDSFKQKHTSSENILQNVVDNLVKNNIDIDHPFLVHTRDDFYEDLFGDVFS